MPSFLPIIYDMQACVEPDTPGGMGPDKTKKRNTIEFGERFFYSERSLRVLLEQQKTVLALHTCPDKQKCKKQPSELENNAALCILSCIFSFFFYLLSFFFLLPSSS